MGLVHAQPYTYEDYKLWQGDWELINGEAVAMAPSPYGSHQGILPQIAFDIRSALGKCKSKCHVYIELDYIVDEFTTVRPDISVVCKKIQEFIRTPPRMIVEILSPSTAMKDKTVKFEIYEREGVEFYMMVDYKLRQVKLYRLIDFQYRKIDDREDGQMELALDDCRIVFDIDGWWDIL